MVICVPAFNIYVIRKIKRSDLRRKWLKYIAVVCLNTPIISYAATAGFWFKLINFQFLLGFSFSYMGYMNAVWTMAIPLGGLYWFVKLRQRADEEPVTDAPIDEIQAVTE